MNIPLPRTLHMRIMLAIAALQVVVVGLFGVYMAAQVVGSEVAKREALGSKIISLTLPTVARMVAEHDQHALDAYLGQLAADPALTGVFVQDAKGTTLFSSSRPALALHPVARWLKASAVGTRLAAELRSGQGYLGLLVLDLSNRALNQNINTLLHNVLLLLLVLLAVDLLASEMLIKYIVAPLGPLTAMALDVSKGNLDSVMPTPERASDEVRHLGDAFIQSAKIMRRQIRELEHTRGQLAQNELRLRNLVDNMQEVLLETDEEGRITFVNPAWEARTGHSVASSLHQPLAGFLVQPGQQAYFAADRPDRVPPSNLRLELRGRDGETVWMQMDTVPRYDDAGRFSGAISTLVDISENLRLQRLQQAHERDLYRLTIADPLTGVLNRRYFDDLLGRVVQANLGVGRQVALIVADIDGFKFINDTFGHPVGDEVLRILADILSRSGHPEASVARLAGDEFAVILENVNEEQADAAARRIHRDIKAASVKLAVGQLQIQSSIGVAVAPVHGRTPHDLMRSADVALYHAKKSGRDRVDTLSRDAGEAIMDIFSQGFELRNALRNGALEPFIQPIVDLDSGQVFAYEVLTRLRRGDQYVAGEAFVHVAEDLGLIREMDLYIIEQSLSLVPEDTHLFLNISLNSFYASEFSQHLRNLLLSPNARGRSITIEFTERQTTTMTAEFVRFFAELREAGCKIALDDFGVGYSSYGYLRQLRPDFIKIDGSFVQQILKNSQDAKIVEQIRDLAVVFEAQTIAEHVESEEVLHALRRMGIKYGQGYRFGRPEPIARHFPKQKAAQA